MTPAEFAKRWIASTQTERAAAQGHFIDLCDILGQPRPSSDPTGERYAFEKGTKKTGGEDDGFADVWLKDHFGWEYKRKKKDLKAAYKQLLDYHEALGQPPLLVVCDLNKFEVHTKWANNESWTYKFTLADIATDDPVEVTTASGPAPDAPKLSALQVLTALFNDPESLKPNRTTDDITKDAAALFQNIAESLRGFRTDDMEIARFITRVVFCMFASDVGLLPRSAFSELLAAQAEVPAEFRKGLADLFLIMRDGGRFGASPIPHFNGDLFEDTDVPRLTTDDILGLKKLDDLNWSDVEPAIFGTLFERVLDPKVRAKLGAHYTSREDIEMLVEPVLMDPLRREWEQLQREIDDDWSADSIGKAIAPFHDKLAATRVPDPACGSGNFLYVSLALLKALEKEVVTFGAFHDVPIEYRVNPSQLYGIEINEFAHELASIVVWIGYLQWKHRNAIPLDNEEPILRKLEQIELKDAIVDLTDPKRPKEPEWPDADVIVGNPPFLGGRNLRRELGEETVAALHRLWESRVRPGSDLCCYWFEKARAAVDSGSARRAGLLGTQAIRGGKNREVLNRIKATGDIFFAVSDRKWNLDGAAVQISMVGFDDGTEERRELDGETVEGINANLTTGFDLGTARRLRENRGVCFMADVKAGSFEIDQAESDRLLRLPNPNGKPNSDVLRPWINALDVTRRPRNLWIVDFPPDMTEERASRFEAPFQLLMERVKPARDKTRRAIYRRRWWVHAEPCIEMRTQI